METPPDSVSISGAFDFYTDKFSDYLALAIAERDQVPLEVLNEIRGAFTHLGKANKLSPDDDDYSAEIRCAHRHLKRASLDCLKLAILGVTEKLDARLDLFIRNGLVLPPETFNRVRALKAERQDLMHAEASHPSHSTPEQMEALYTEYADCLITLDKHYASDQITHIQMQREKEKAEWQRERDKERAEQKAARRNERRFAAFLTISGVLISIYWTDLIALFYAG